MKKENKMGVLPIPKLLITMSLPMVISMLVQALYNIVDSIFVAKLSEEALTAVSLAFPVQNLMIAIASGTGVGINALLSRSLGEKNFDRADKAAQNGIFLAILSCIAMAVIGLLGSHAFFLAQTDQEAIVKYGTQYMQVVTIVSVGIFNIIMDPILIFGLFGFPRLEVAGAAIATVFGQLVAVCLCIFFNCRYNKEIHINMLHFRPDLSTIGEIYRVGVPSIIMQSIGSVMVFGFNKILLVFSTTAAALFGVYFKLQSFIFMPVFGLNNGMIPIVAYNYGARKKKRIMETVRLSVCISIGIMFLGLLAFQIMPVPLLHLFDASDHMIEIGVPALRIISIHFLLAGYSIIISSSFQALGNGFYSLIISAVRQLVVILPVAYLLSHLFGLHSVWFSVPIAELVSVILCTLLFRRIKRLKLDPLDSPKSAS